MERDTRRRYSNANKLAMLRYLERQIAKGVSIRVACSEINIDPARYREWKKQREVLILRNPTAKSIDKGRTSILQNYQEQLLRFIFEKREQGAEVTILMVALQAASLSQDFREKSRGAQLKSAARFVAKHEYVYRTGTNVSQRSPESMQTEAADFMAQTRPLLQEKNRSTEFIINMDQTPVYFTLQRGRTLAKRGTRTVGIRKSIDDTRRCTFAATVTASGRFLMPLIVFKGSPCGRIVKNELPTFPDNIIYACQDNAWMDETVMLMWVERILRPYVAKAPLESFLFFFLILFDVT